MAANTLKSVKDLVSEEYKNVFYKIRDVKHGPDEILPCLKHNASLALDDKLERKESLAKLNRSIGDLETDIWGKIYSLCHNDDPQTMTCLHEKFSLSNDLIYVIRHCGKNQQDVYKSLVDPLLSSFCIAPKLQLSLIDRFKSGIKAVPNTGAASVSTFFYFWMTIANIVNDTEDYYGLYRIRLGISEEFAMIFKKYTPAEYMPILLASDVCLKLRCSEDVIASMIMADSNSPEYMALRQTRNYQLFSSHALGPASLRQKIAHPESIGSLVR
ncbi:MAG TPA: hypothetical protein DCR21_01115 [Succinivibrionaceae bacterium]|nr:hypothetical protein [Succinivibrionaceae bacterium]